jgi:hypothetical protein
MPRLVQPQHTVEILWSRFAVFPQNLAGLHADGKYVVSSGNDVKNALINHGLRFAGVFHRESGAIQMRLPNRLELAHIFTIDLL